MCWNQAARVDHMCKKWTARGKKIQHDVHYNGAKAQSFIVQKICTTGGQSLLSLLGTSKKNFSFHFNHYNLTIHAINFFETFCTCFPSSLVQDPTVKIPKIDFFPFLLIELEMADLSIFLRKMTFVL
jgi:hypothetical protein